MCGLEEIERDMGLALMVRLVPSEDAQDIDQGQLPLFEALGDGAEVFVVELGQGGEQVGAGFGEYLANEGRWWDFVVGLAATFETGNEVGEGRLGSGNQTFGRKELLGDANVRELPGDMGPARPGPPAQDFLWIFFLFDFVEQLQRAGAIELICGYQAMDGAHGRFQLSEVRHETNRKGRGGASAWAEKSQASWNSSEYMRGPRFMIISLANGA